MKSKMNMVDGMCHWIISITFGMYNRVSSLRVLILMGSLFSDIGFVCYHSFDAFADSVHAPMASGPGISSSWKLLHLLGT